MEQRRHQVIVILAGMLVGVLLFIFGIRLANHNIVIDLIYTVMAIAVLASSLIASLKQYREQKDYIFLFLLLLSVFLIGICLFYVSGDLF